MHAGKSANMLIIGKLALSWLNSLFQVKSKELMFIRSEMIWKEKLWPLCLISLKQINLFINFCVYQVIIYHLHWLNKLIKGFSFFFYLDMNRKYLPDNLTFNLAHICWRILFKSELLTSAHETDWSIMQKYKSLNSCQDFVYFNDFLF